MNVKILATEVEMKMEMGETEKKKDREGHLLGYKENGMKEGIGTGPKKELNGEGRRRLLIR